jgi:hypothetical protein
MMAKVSRVCTRENLQPAHRDACYAERPRSPAPVERARRMRPDGRSWGERCQGTRCSRPKTPLAVVPTSVSSFRLLGLPWQSGVRVGKRLYSQHITSCNGGKSGAYSRFNVYGVIRSPRMTWWKGWGYSHLWRVLSRVLFERSMDRYRCALEHHKAVCPEIWCCGRPSGMLGSYARIALVPPERPGGHRWPGRLHRKDLS